MTSLAGASPGGKEGRRQTKGVAQTKAHKNKSHIETMTYHSRQVCLCPAPAVTRVRVPSTYYACNMCGSCGRSYRGRLLAPPFRGPASSDQPLTNHQKAHRFINGQRGLGCTTLPCAPASWYRCLTAPAQERATKDSTSHERACPREPQRRRAKTTHRQKQRTRIGQAERRRTRSGAKRKTEARSKSTEGRERKKRW